MLFEDTYYTISDPAEASLKEKGSKFIGIALPIYSEKEAKQKIEDIKKLHPKANHHCYAYKLGLGNDVYRVNDDGEPSNTAGRPILGQIQSHQLSNILIVVVRYFGGTLLGIGGLINAYRATALSVIKSATIVQKTVNEYYEIQFGYEQLSEVMTIIKREKLIVTSQKLGTLNTTCFYTSRNNASHVCALFKKMPNLVLQYIKSE